MWRMTLVIRPGCVLCSDAKRAIEEFSQETPVLYQEVDADRDSNTQAKYGSDVPVLLVDDREVARCCISAKRLRNFSRLRESGRGLPRLYPSKAGLW